MGQKSDSIKTPFHPTAEFRDSELSKIELNLIAGDKGALTRLEPYLDSIQILNEHLGYHLLRTPEREIAQRLLLENCLFTEKELKITDSLSSEKLRKFLRLNFDNIHFDFNANAFLITPLTGRETVYQIKDLSEHHKLELRNKATDLLNTDFVAETDIGALIKNKNPLALLKIASELFKGRNRFNGYRTDNAATCLQLLQLLTGTEISVEDEHHQLIAFIDRDYYPDPRLNLMIYFAKNYPLYKWDNNSGLFYLPGVNAQPVNRETEYFEMLNSKTDSVAINAFIKLTTCNPDTVTKIANRYEKADIAKNYMLPTFPYRFLMQLPALTAYCKNNHIDFIGSPRLRRNIALLKDEMTFADRRKLEDKLIKTSTFNDITALEYWSIIYERWNYLNYSVGRILDIFYSNNWNRIIHNKTQLNLYLKKSKLYNDLGIIGICNNYLKKFNNSNVTELNTLKDQITEDNDIKQQFFKVLGSASKKPITRNLKKLYNTNFESKVENLEKAFYDILNDHFIIIKDKPDSEKRDTKVAELFSKINYNQIGTGLKIIENYSFAYKWMKYAFIERDFGFFMDDFENKQTRKTFLNYYLKHTEREVYAHYLFRAKIDYMKANHSLDYDKIYDLLKYDVVTAFVGGGGGQQDNEVYTLIKLLELKFKTTLGYPAKLCNSQGVYGCNSAERAKTWMAYLKTKRLLKLPHNTPESFSY